MRMDILFVTVLTVLTGIACSRDPKDPVAQCNLGSAYLYGDSAKGIGRDLGRARELLQKAADQGNARAMAVMGDSFWGTSGKEEIYMSWYQKAAALGDGHAMERMATEMNSMGNYHNPVESRKWLEKAANAGDGEAKTQLDRIKEAEDPNTAAGQQMAQLKAIMAASGGSSSYSDGGPIEITDFSVNTQAGTTSGREVSGTVHNKSKSFIGRVTVITKDLDANGVAMGGSDFSILNIGPGETMRFERKSITINSESAKIIAVKY